MAPQEQPGTTTLEPDDDRPPSPRPWTDYRPQDGPVWLIVLWPLLVLLTAPLPELDVSIWTGVITGTHLGMAAADLARNPPLDQMRWRRTSLVLLPPVYLFRRQRIVGGAQWPAVAWVASFVISTAAALGYGMATDTIEDWSVAEVERLMEETIGAQLPGPVSVQVDCGDDPQVVDDAIVCDSEYSDGSTVQLRVTATFSEVAWKPVPGSATAPSAGG